LEDFSISRLKEKMSWGIPIPGHDNHVMYVWFDALVNYISTLGWPEDVENFEAYWKNGTPTQYCGKDNTRFQAVMWQAMLMAADLPPSAKIIVDGFITGEGGVKMSKSLGNVINPYDIVKEYGPDALRYFVTRELSSFEDSPFFVARFKEAYNAGLANGLGNLVSRVMKMAVSYGVKYDASEFSVDEDGLPLNDKFVVGYKDSLAKYNLQGAMNAIWLGIMNWDLIIQQKEPFKKIKTNPEEAKNDIKFLLFDLMQISIMLKPFMPATSEKISKAVLNNEEIKVPLFPRIP